MNLMPGSIDTQLIGMIGAIAIAFLAFRLIFKLFQQESKTVLALVIIFLIYQFVLDVSPREIWFEISHLPQAIAQFIQRLA